MKEPLYQIKNTDNVGVALSPIGDIPQGHKVALKDIEPEEQIIKYGFPAGKATRHIKKGQHVHTHNVKTLLSQTPEYNYNPTQPLENRLLEQVPAQIPKIDVFRRIDGSIGIRNEIWIIPAVGCVNKTAEMLAGWAEKEISGNGIDGVYAWTHPYGCSQMGGDHEATKTILANLAKHPNAAAVLVLFLGCENNTFAEFKSALGSYAEDSERIVFLVTQDCADELEEGKALLKKLATNAGKAKREKAKISELIVGMKCGASDGFSGITANPLAGKVCDTLCGMGASFILTEVPEMFGAEQILMDRCETRDLFDKTVSLISDFKEYFHNHNQVIYENPSPGNKAGGITTLEEKSIGCVQKGGNAPVRGVYRYGERVSPNLGGLALLDGPGNDIVSTTVMTAAGAHIILFTTGRGTPLGAPVPTIKISSNSSLAEKKAAWIDFNSGDIFEAGDEALCSELLELITDIVSGRKKAKNEINGYREIAIFKNGVTL